MIYPIAFLGLGSNVGDRERHLASAIVALQEYGEITMQSDWVETPAWGLTDQPAFLNGVVAIQPFLGPWGLLQAILEIERQHGRSREIKWGPRTLDIDILAFGQWLIHSPDLTVPHPYCTQRAFVLEPWNQIAPDFTLAGFPIHQWWSVLPNK